MAEDRKRVPIRLHADIRRFVAGMQKAQREIQDIALVEGRPYDYKDEAMSGHRDHVHFPEYNNGGIIPLRLTRIGLDPDECVVRAKDGKCLRADHPTDSSDCA